MANLNGWKRKLRNLIDDPWTNSGDSDHPDCPECGSTMNFYGHDSGGDFPLGEGYWSCPSCGFNITEDELNS